jgi:UDP-2-acetamido-3-amino-2,3-dideoxy-glucuronate N-acetyltransferase
MVRSASVSAYFKHESAVVDEGAVIGDRTTIWHFCHVAGGARIGSDCVLGQGVYVAGTVIIGDGVRIQNQVSIYDGVTIDSHVFIGPSAVFTNVRNPRSEIPRKHEYQPTHVARGATIGANATVVCGHSIGAYAFIGAGSVVTANIPAFALVVGVPARQIGWMCRCGVRLTVEHGASYCATCGRGYRVEAGDLLEA